MAENEDAQTAVTQQPDAGPGGPPVAIISPGQCPPGMEYLLYTDTILVHQLVELLEVFTGFDTANKYAILDAAGNRVYFAAETTGCCVRMCFGSKRPFELIILNNEGQTVMKVKREMSCLLCCCGAACVNVIQIYTGSDELIGEVKQKCCECCTPQYIVKDANGQNRLTIEGPCFCCMCCEVTFKVYQDGQEIGAIQKKWGGILKEAFTQADTFGVYFPAELDVSLKCLLLGAVFLIDFMYFENAQKNNHHQHF